MMDWFSSPLSFGLTVDRLLTHCTDLWRVGCSIWFVVCTRTAINRFTVWIIGLYWHGVSPHYIFIVHTFIVKMIIIQYSHTITSERPKYVGYWFSSSSVFIPNNCQKRQIRNKSFYCGDRGSPVLAFPTPFFNWFDITWRLYTPCFRCYPRPSPSILAVLTHSICENK